MSNLIPPQNQDAFKEQLIYKLKKDQIKQLIIQTLTQRKNKNKSSYLSLNENEQKKAVLDDKFSLNQDNSINQIQNFSEIQNFDNENFYNNSQQLEKARQQCQLEDLQLSDRDLERMKLEELFKQSFSSIANIQKLKRYNLQINNILQQLLQRNYYLTKYINSGGEGDIFQGFKKNNDKDGIEEYAFKIYLGLSAQVLKEEIDIMKSFEDYINIIKLYDEIKVDDQFYILVLEKCEYSLYDELIQIVDKKKEFPIHQLFQIIFDLLDGLLQLRIYETLHLDIKPSNILKSSKGIYIYTDFGCSSKIKKGQQIHQKGFTKNYASDEQINNQIDKIHYLSDIQSLGKTLKLVIQIYLKVNQSDDVQEKSILEEINKIIEDNIDRSNIQDRQNVKVIHELVIKLLIKYDLMLGPLLNQYSLKCKKINNLFTYDTQKDIKYFQDVKIYYLKVNLQIYQWLINLYKIHYYKTDEMYQQYKKQSSLEKAQCNNQSTQNQNCDDHQKYLTQLYNYNYCQVYYAKKISSTLYSLGLCYFDLGDYKQSYEEILKSLNKYQVLDPQPKFADSIFLLAQCFHKLGQTQNSLECSKGFIRMVAHIWEIKKSFPLRLEILEEYKKYLNVESNLKLFKKAENKILYDPSQDPHYIAKTQQQISQLYSNLGISKIALNHAKQSYSINLSIQEGNDQKIAKSLQILSSCYLDQGDPQNAIGFAKQSLEIFQKLYQGNHPSISSSLELLGQCYQDLGDSKNALKYAKESLEMNKLLYNENHPSISSSLSLLVESYRGMGDSQNALKSAQEALLMIEQLYGGNNISISHCLQNLGKCFFDLGDLQTALKYAIKSHKIIEQPCFGNNIQIANSSFFLSLCYFELGDKQNSIKYVNQSYERFYQLYEGDYSKMITTLQKSFGNQQNCFKYAKKFHNLFDQHIYKQNTLKEQKRKLNQQKLQLKLRSSKLILTILILLAFFTLRIFNIIFETKNLNN